jgi:hypothetical protein
MKVRIAESLLDFLFNMPAMSAPLDAAKRLSQTAWKFRLRSVERNRREFCVISGDLWRLPEELTSFLPLADPTARQAGIHTQIAFNACSEFNSVL